VRFQVADVFLPSPGGGFPAIEEEEELEGTITCFSDSGSAPRFFALVEVVRTQSLIVPVDKLTVITTSKLERDV
jgi:hypothetical protein